MYVHVFNCVFACRPEAVIKARFPGGSVKSSNYVKIPSW